jgi:hypothetical protein
MGPMISPRLRTKPSPWVSMSVALLTAATAGCGSSGGGGGGGTGGGASGGSGGAGSVQLAGPCDDAAAAGNLSLVLKDAFSQFGGAVYDKPDPSNDWSATMTSGDCRLIVPPQISCSPACGSGTVCVAKNQCGAPQVFHTVGTITITGLNSAVTANPVGNPPTQYFASISEFPPAAPGAVITLTTTGGDYAPFTLKGQGIDPLVFPAPTAMVKDNQPLPFTWTPPTAGNATRIVAELNFSRHGNTKQAVTCDLPDTGSSQIPATLVHALLSLGTAGFPTLTLTRRTIDSTTIAPGCVDFAVAAYVEQPVMIEGVTSCNCNGAECQEKEDPLPCPSGRTCRTTGTVGGLTCD